MDATIEQPALTLKEAEQGIKDWQDKLQEAQAALANHEQQVGQLALAHGVDSVVETEVRLRTEVKRAEAGLQAAQQQREAVRRVEQSKRAEQIRAEADELDKKLNEEAAFLNEWGPKVEAARNRLEYGSRRHSLLLSQADEIERKLKEAN
jgi:hypothetical protein